MSEVPAAVLSKVWENADYYAAIGTTVHIKTDDDTEFEFEVDEVDVVRYHHGKPHDSKGRRAFKKGMATLWVDYASNDGQPTQTLPWLNETAAESEIVTVASIEAEVANHV